MDRSVAEQEVSLSDVERPGEDHPEERVVGDEIGSWPDIELAAGKASNVPPLAVTLLADENRVGHAVTNILSTQAECCALGSVHLHGHHHTAVRRLGLGKVVTERGLASSPVRG